MKKKRGWIPVGKKMPEKFEDVLITEEYEGSNSGKHFVYVGVGHLINIKDGKPKWSSEGGRNYNVTAWQPLPEPYRAKGR